MKTLKLAVLAVAVIAACSGCKTYNESKFTPDSFNYTLAVDQDGMKPAQHYFGLSWSLKDSK